MKQCKLILFIILSLQFFSCHVPRAILWWKPDYKDAKRLPSYQVNSSKKASKFEMANSVKKERFKALLENLKFNEDYLENSGKT